MAALTDLPDTSELALMAYKLSSYASDVEELRRVLDDEDTPADRDAYRAKLAAIVTATVSDLHEIRRIVDDLQRVQERAMLAYDEAWRPSPEQDIVSQWHAGALKGAVGERPS